MNMTQEMLEILIGKYIDGEITPSEQRILEAELDRDSHAKELLRQLQDLHERSCEAITSEIIGQGRAAEEIFEQAWRQQSKHPLRLTIKTGGYMRFAAGVAAGLVIGLALHFVLPAASTPKGDLVQPNAIAQKPENEVNLERLTSPWPLSDPAGDVVHNVDWYSFTDKEGNQWLVEGLRENMVRPAVYYEDL